MADKTARGADGRSFVGWARWTRSPVGEGRAFAVGDEQVAVFRPRSGGLHALQAICPHRGGPLADGPIDGQHVICPLHNHAFRLADGHRTTGERSVQAYQVAVEDGEVVLRL